MEAAPAHCGMKTTRTQHHHARVSPARGAGRLERALMAVGVCLPVPIMAATGLSVPLPSVVERVAAELVPFAAAAELPGNEPPARGNRGRVVLLVGERPAVAAYGGESGRVFVRHEPGGRSRDRRPSPRGKQRPAGSNGASTLIDWAPGEESAHTSGDAPRNDPSPAPENEPSRSAEQPPAANQPSASSGASGESPPPPPEPPPPPPVPPAPVTPPPPPPVPEVVPELPVVKDKPVPPGQQPNETLPPAPGIPGQEKDKDKGDTGNGRGRASGGDG
jgi:hypothetical protein